MDRILDTASQYVDPSVLYIGPDRATVVTSDDCQVEYDTVFPIFPKPSVPLSSTRRLTANELFDATMYVRGLKLKLSYEIKSAPPKIMREEQIEAYDQIFYDLWFHVCMIDRKLYIYACVLEDEEMHSIIATIVHVQYQQALFSSGTSVYLVNFDTALRALAFLKDVANRLPDTGDA